MRVLTTIVLLVAACDGPGHSRGFVIDGPQQCPTCRIQLIRIARLTSNDGAGQAAFPSLVMRDLAGRYFVGPTLVEGTVAVFSSDGALLRTVGRFGRGPGEMREVQSIARWHGDSVAIVHERKRASVFTRELEYARTITFQAASFGIRRITLTQDGQLLAAWYSTGGGENPPLREFSPTGLPVRSYGRPTLYNDRSYSAAVAAADTVWAANHAVYEIDVYSRSSSKRLQSFARRRSWFPGTREQNEWGGRPAVVDIARASPGRLWVLLMRPRPDYHFVPRGHAAEFEPAAAVQPGVGDMAEWYEYILELLDLDKRRAVVSATLSRRVPGGFLDGAHLYGYEENPATGSLSVVIWRLRIRE